MDDFSVALRLTAPKAYQPERMSRCKAAKLKKISRPTKQSGHFPGLRYDVVQFEGPTCQSFPSHFKVVFKSI